MSILSRLSLSTPREVRLLGIDGSEKGRAVLPPAFNAPLRPMLVRRVYNALFTHKLQPKGAWKGSGHKYSVESLGAGYGLARISRLKVTGTGKSNAGGLVPSAVGGRPTHPPVPEKKIRKEVNEKERKAALASALAFTASPEWVRKRGHRLPDSVELPIVVGDEIERVSRARELVDVLTRLGLGEELERCKERKVRAGKGKMRGRRYKSRVGPLIVVARDEGVSKAAGSIPGVDVVLARDLSVLHLAPGGHPGRLVIFSSSSLEVLRGVFGG
jgi:large subunit ribosomal protein L4e